MKKPDARLQRLYQIVEVGASMDLPSRAYDFFGTFMLILNIAVSVLYTFENIRLHCGAVLTVIEQITAGFFALDYVLRLITARAAYPELNGWRATGKYMLSFYGLVDLGSFLPFYLPFFFPAGLAAFRMIRVVRIFRLFRLNVYYDSLNVITEVLKSRKQQLLSSVFIILVLMLASSLCMYSIEHEAQPEVFRNAFSGIWWSVSTLLTVGYGDIYPITGLGRVFSIIITFLGVGMVAIPTGIISAGFVEQYTRLKELGDNSKAGDIDFIRLDLGPDDAWTGQTVGQLDIPRDAAAALIFRDSRPVTPRPDTVLQAGDVLLLCTGRSALDAPIRLQSVTVGPHSAWKDCPVRELDISRRTVIATVRRGSAVLTPHGDTVIREGDELLLYANRQILAEGNIPV